jgi:septation ring formation regulator EzrA
MDLDISKLTEEQLEFVSTYKRINERLETLQRQMTIIQHEAKCLVDELEDLRKKENKINNGKK